MKKELPVNKSSDVTLWLDEDVIAYFKKSGAGWQSRINDLLKAIVASVPRKAKNH